MSAKSIRQFIKLETISGILLLGAASLALIINNSPWKNVYQLIFNQPIIIYLAHHPFHSSLLHIINEGLMTLFFLLLGLEIKREMLVGELSTRAKISLPGLAALGGMLVPALIYILLNRHNVSALRGWAIPTATDVAFSLAVLSLVSSRVPIAVKIFLTALAIFDDIGAIIIIAVFYAVHISTIFLGLALLCWLALWLLNFARVKNLTPYLFLGILLWYCLLGSGVHSVLAGIALAFTIPLQNDGGPSPSHLLEQRLHPWVAFGILPVFGLANAGISFAGLSWGALFNPICLGTALGLFLGKQLGVFTAVWLAVKTKLAQLPDNTNFSQIYGVALVCGIGFTMSLFIGTLAFNSDDDLSLVRLGVLTGSLFSGLLGYLWLRLSTTVIQQESRVRKTEQ